MMEIIPAIDLLDGKCVRLNQGDYDQVTKFSNNPVQQALLWQTQGASRLHLVDLDGAKTGLPEWSYATTILPSLSRRSIISSAKAIIVIISDAATISNPVL